MKKEKIQVLRMLSKSDIEAIGGSRWSFRMRWILFTLFIISFSWMAFWARQTTASTINAYIALTPMFVSFLWWYIGYCITGKRFYNLVKDKEQPIDLE